MKSGFSLKIGSNNQPLDKTFFTPQTRQMVLNKNPSLPSSVTQVKQFYHNEVVCAVTVSTKTKKILTGGKGIVKIWDISDELESDHDNDGSSRSSSRNGSRSNSETKEIHRLNGLPDGNYIRSCKIFSNGQKLIVGGEANKLSYWDLNASGGPTKMTDLQLQAPACYALCIPESDN